MAPASTSAKLPRVPLHEGGTLFTRTLTYAVKGPLRFFEPLLVRPRILQQSGTALLMCFSTSLHAVLVIYKRGDSKSRYGSHLRRLTNKTPDSRVIVRTILPLPFEMAKRVG